MKIPRFRSHRSWSELSSAYADGSLDRDSIARFEGHLAGCARCQAETADFRAVRAALVRLPDHAAPRSFHITPAMLLEPPRDEPLPAPVAGGSTRVVMVAARFTAGIAAAGLAALMVVDFGGVGGSDGDGGATSASMEMSQITMTGDGDAAAGSLPADESVTTESFASATGTAMNTLEPTAPVETPDVSGAGTGGGEDGDPASTPEPTPQPPSTGGEDPEQPSDTVEDAGRQTANDSAYDAAGEAALTSKSAEDSDGIDRGWLRGGQVALGVLLALAIGAIVFLPVRRNAR
jgi:hypothetical protein